jgi:regulator of sigma E protease
MHWSLIFLLSTTILTVVYYLCYFTLAIIFRVNNRHYFLGFGNSLFEFKVKDVLFTVGIFIPVFGLARFYKVEDYARKRPDYPWQFSDRPLLIRVLVTYGGVMSLFLSALIILIAIRFFVSDRFISREEINKHGIYPSALAEQYGFERGDKVLTVNGRDFESYHELLDPDVYAKAGNTFKVVRNGAELIIRVPEGDHDLAPRYLFLELMAPVIIDSVLSGSPAEEIGLQKEDRIARVNGVRVDKVNDMREAFSKDADGMVDLQIQRVNTNDTVTLAFAVQLDERHHLGILTREPMNYTTKENSFPEAVGKGTRATLQLVTAQISSWFGLANPSRKSGGPVSISTVLGDTPNWQRFWYLTANWAIVFVTWKFCPFPRSAFWQTIPLVYEGVTRKKYPYSFFRGSRLWGWIIFWGLILFTFVMDISKLF